jgi:aspartate oxidase
MLTRQQAAEELSKHYDPASIAAILGEADEYSQYEDDTVVAETLTTDGRVDGYLIYWL